MHARVSTRFNRRLISLFAVLVLAGCGEGDGPDRIEGTAATPLPAIPPGFCDAINFEILCPPATIVNFNGGATTVIDNPDASGINTSDSVAQMQKFPDEVFGGTRLDLDAPVDFSNGEYYTVKVWSQRPVELSFKLEETGNPAGGVTLTANHSGSGTWEELCYNFTGLPATIPTPVQALTVIFDNGTLGAADTDPMNWTFYYDDITQVATCGGGGPTGPDLPVNFEDAGGPYSFSDFGGGAASVIDNPDQSGLNTSAKTAQMQKFAGEVFGGSTLTLGNAIDFSQGEAFTVNVWASRMVPVLFKLEGLNQELSVDHTGSSTWEQLCFDFTGNTAGPAANAITFIFDLGVAGDAGGDPANWTFYFDDIEQVADCSGGGGGPGGGAPTMAAPTPAQDPADVISLFSDAYTDVTVDTFRAGFSVGDLANVDIAGNAALEYTNLDFVGIETVSAPLDVSGMTHFHIDIWTPDATSVSLKLVDFGGDGFGGGNDTEGPITFDAGSTPPLTQGNWISLDISLVDMQNAGLANLTDINQLILSAAPAGATTLFVDNIYFYNDGGGAGGNAPTTSAPTPMQNAADVISLFSDVYTDPAVTWPTPWSVPNDTTSDVTIDGGTVKEHLNVSFIGVEFASTDVSGMTHFHIDVWTPDADNLLLKLVDFGGDGFGGGNDSEGPLTFDAASTPALGQGTWVSLDIPLADMQAAGLANLTDINQLVLDPGPDGTALYVDNVYFYNDNPGGGGAPTMAAPAPMQDPADVISLFSDAYTDVAVTWPTPWSVPNDMVSDVMIDGQLAREHLNVSFVGVEFSGQDVSGMTHFHVDVWTPDADSLLIKLVDFGGDGFGGGNDTEGEVGFDAMSTPALTQGTWVSLDIPLADFQAAGLASLTDINQLIFDPAPDGTTLYIDNVYFYDDGSGGGAAPTTSAPTPMQNAADVISLFSDEYTDPAVTWPTPWSVPNDTTSDVMIDGGTVKEHLNVSFIGVEFASTDVSGMTHFHIDVWTPDADNLLLKLVDFGGDGFGGGNDSEGPLTFDAASTPALAQGTWVSLDIPLADMQAAGLANLTDINQLVLDPGPDGTALYVDNVYFYNDTPGGGTAPTTSAATPMQNAADVISLYSDAYTDLAVTWPTPWSVPNDMTMDVMIDGGLVKENLNVSFIGVEFASLDASGMTHFHVDVWTPDATSLLLKLVDFGGDGFGGGNDSEGPLTFDAGSMPALTQGTWVSLDIPLADMQAAGLANLTDINQFVFDPGPDGTAVYIDNVYFYNDNPGGGTAPTTSAPTPTQNAADVMSLYSDAYTDQAVTWPTPWSVPNDMTSDITVDGGLVKENLNVSFIGVEFASTDVSAMTHFRMDVWTPDATSLLVKLVDFGGDGFGGGNDSEGPLTFDAMSTPALAQGTWVSLDIPLADMQAAGLANLTDINQLVFDPGPDGTAVYVDNVYFYNDGGGGGAPTMNGGFEDLAFDNTPGAVTIPGWVVFENGGTIEVTNADANTGTYSVRLAAGELQNPLIKLFELEQGVVQPGDPVDIEFYMRGTAGAGGVIFPELFSEGDPTTNEILETIAVPNATWTRYAYSTTAGADVSRGITFQLAAVCGGVMGCSVEIFVDDVVVTIGGGT
ncbi:MAG: hypothetical protein AAF351_08065 [Pseudomonadota bacterium]